MLAHLADPLADPGRDPRRRDHADSSTTCSPTAHPRQPQPQPVAVCTLARETHDADLPGGELTQVQHASRYSDGFGREIQQKAARGAGSRVGRTARWVGSGWTVFNNKGKPVRQYEPFFSATHRFEFARTAGVSPVLFYDPVGRVVATLHPDHTWEKVVFDPWRQETWDVNDTVLLDPPPDADVADHFRRLPEAELPARLARRARPTAHSARTSRTPRPRRPCTPAPRR